GGDAAYAVDVDVAAGVVTVGPPERLLVAAQDVGGWTWVDRPLPAGGCDVLVQCSAHGRPRPARVVPSTGAADVVEVRWAEPQRRVAPGQAVVLYDLADDRVLGGGSALAVTGPEG